MTGLAKFATTTLLDVVATYAESADEATAALDSASMDIARALDELYERREWVDEWEREKPPRPDAVGRPPVVDSRNRFHAWLTWKESTRGRAVPAPRTLRQLATATRIERVVSGATGATNSERALRPLAFLVTSGRGEYAADIWRRAIELAGGATPTSEHTRQAVAEWRKTNRGDVDPVVVDGSGRCGV